MPLSFRKDIFSVCLIFLSALNVYSKKNETLLIHF